MTKPTAKSRRRRKKYDPSSSRRIPPQVDPNDQKYRSKFVVKIDMTGVTSGFSPLPVASYPVTFTDAEVKPSKSTEGAFVVNFTLTVNDEGGEYAGRKVFGNWSLQPKALWRLKQDAVAFGIDPKELEGELDTDILLPDLKGRSAIVDLTIDSYKANDGTQKERNQIANIHEAKIEVSAGRRR